MNKHLSLRPKRLSKLAWRYEEPNGIVVCIQPVVGGRTLDAVMATISWRDIRESLRRKDLP